MCGVVAAYLENPTPDDIDTLRRLFSESKIRGRHQTGLAFSTPDRVEKFVVEGDGDKFLEKFDWSQLLSRSKLELIGHNRYSTSDLNYPQPIQVFSDAALAHNGVVDQRPFVHWGDYGYELTTRNDSELLYHCSYRGEEPLEKYPEASMAVAEVSLEKGLRWYRNGKRPLYNVKVENGWFVCSTADIALRSGLTNPRRCIAGSVYTPQGIVKSIKVEELIP